MLKLKSSNVCCSIVGLKQKPILWLVSRVDIRKRQLKFSTTLSNLVREAHRGQRANNKKRNSTSEVYISSTLSPSTYEAKQQLLLDNNNIENRT